MARRKGSGAKRITAEGGKATSPVSDLGLKDLAEAHMKSAVDRLAKLVDDEDARVAFEASQLILRLSRPYFPGPVVGPGFGPGFGGRTPWGGWGPGDVWGDPWGGGRAG